jgi:hypothetical protein
MSLNIRGVQIANGSKNPDDEQWNDNLLIAVVPIHLSGSSYKAPLWSHLNCVLATKLSCAAFV